MQVNVGQGKRGENSILRKKGRECLRIVERDGMGTWGGGLGFRVFTWTKQKRSNTGAGTRKQNTGL